MSAPFGTSSVIAEATAPADLVTKDGMTNALRDLEQRLTVRIGSMLAVATGILVAITNSIFFSAAVSPRAARTIR